MRGFKSTELLLIVNSLHTAQNTKSKEAGCILGPLLFILFMNDFSCSSTLLFSILFADDTSVFLEVTEYSKLIKSLIN